MALWVLYVINTIAIAVLWRRINIVCETLLIGDQINDELLARIRKTDARLDQLMGCQADSLGRIDELDARLSQLTGGHPYRSKVFLSAPRRPATKERREATERAVANLDLGNTLSHDEMFSDRDIKPGNPPEGE